MLDHHIALVPGHQMGPRHRQAVLTELAAVAAALQVQVMRDFRPLWHIEATIGIFPTIRDVPVGHWPIVIKDKINAADELGFHLDKHNQPSALVAYTPDWSITMSHEVLEMLVDFSGNRTVAGPSIHPDHPNHRVRYLLELCDPCEDSTYRYTINGVAVSDFITPAYHDPQDTHGARYSFAGHIKRPRQVLPNGYLVWHDPIVGKWFRWDQGETSGADDFEISTVTGMQGKRSLREHVNTKTPPPSASYHHDSAEMRAARARRKGAIESSAADAKRLGRLG